MCQKTVRCVCAVYICSASSEQPFCCFVTVVFDAFQIGSNGRIIRDIRMLFCMLQNIWLKKQLKNLNLGLSTTGGVRVAPKPAVDCVDSVLAVHRPIKLCSSTPTALHSSHSSHIVLFYFLQSSLSLLFTITDLDPGKSFILCLSCSYISVCYFLVAKVWSNRLVSL